MITRRKAMAFAAAAPAAMTVASRVAKAQGRPNIVFIMADDLGYADLSCYGRREFRTPNIDTIATAGLQFMQAYANSSVCSATRTALMTGRYQYRLPVGLEEPIAARNVGLPSDHPTLPSLLRKGGYITALIGKWHLGSLPDYSPLKSGYEYFWGFRTGAIDYFTHRNNNGSPDLWDQDLPVEQTGYMTDLIGDKAVAVIGDYARSKQPFLLSLHFNAPHWPWEGPSDQAESNRVATARDLHDFDGGTQDAYASMVTRMDVQVGRVLKALQAGGIAGNTIVIFTSDNGGERFSATWPFTGKKTELLEGGLRIPAVIRWPGHIRAGTVSQQVAITMDWVPTLLELASASPDPAWPLDGLSLASTITRGAPSVPRTLFWRYRSSAQRAVREGDLKWLRIAGNEFLFNVVEDPLERSNLKNRRPDLFRKLAADWDAWNSTMLPEDSTAFSEHFTGAQLADHYTPDPAVPNGR